MSKPQLSNSQNPVLLILILSSFPYIILILFMPWRHMGAVDVKLHALLIMYPLNYLSIYLPTYLLLQTYSHEEEYINWNVKPPTQ